MLARSEEYYLLDQVDKIYCFQMQILDHQMSKLYKKEKF